MVIGLFQCRRGDGDHIGDFRNLNKLRLDALIRHVNIKRPLIGLRNHEKVIIIINPQGDVHKFQIPGKGELIVWPLQKYNVIQPDDRPC